MTRIERLGKSLQRNIYNDMSSFFVAYDHSDKKSKLLGCLLIGALSMLYAEVGSGASNLWFLDPFGWLLTFVLYALHTLFYFNIAVRLHKTSIQHLYLLGMLFALYEAPITQVLWSGYIDQGSAMWGTFLGVAWGEFLVLVFFWHPVMSFILPILTYEVFILEGNEEEGLGENVLPTHTEFFARLAKKKKWLFFFTILFTPFQLIGSGFDIVISLISILGTIALAILFKKSLSWLKRRRGINQAVSLKDITLGKRGMITITLVLIFWVYGFGSFAISTFVPGRWPKSLQPYLTIALFALIVILLFVTSSTDLQNEKHEGMSEQTSELEYQIDMSELAQIVKRIWIVWILSTVAFAIIPPAGLVVGFLMYLTMIPIGIIFFGKIIQWLLKSRLLAP